MEKPDVCFWSSVILAVLHMVMGTLASPGAWGCRLDESSFCWGSCTADVQGRDGGFRGMKMGVMT